VSEKLAERKIAVPRLT